MAIDGGLRKLFKEKLPEFHWQAIETGGTGRGIPDSNFCGLGVEGWIEFKKTDGWTITSFKPEQVAWILKRTAAGGRVFVGVVQARPAGPRNGKPSKVLWVVPGQHVRALYGLPLPKEKPQDWLVMDQPWDWDAVRKFITE